MKYTLFCELVQFSRHPEFWNIEKKERFSWKILFKIIVTHAFFLGVALAFIRFGCFLLEDFKFLRPETSKLNDFYIFNSTLKYIVITCFCGPFFEEALFRLGLSFKRVHVAISIAIVYLAIFGNIFGVICWKYVVINGAAIAVFFIIYQLNIAKYLEHAHDLKRMVIYASIIVFGFLHITNYAPLVGCSIPYYLLYSLPPLIAGFMFTYVRITFGFKFSVAYHSANNIIAFFIFHSVF